MDVWVFHENFDVPELCDRADDQDPADVSDGFTGMTPDYTPGKLRQAARTFWPSEMKGSAPNALQNGEDRISDPDYPVALIYPNGNDAYGDPWDDDSTYATNPRAWRMYWCRHARSVPAPPPPG